MHTHPELHHLHMAGAPACTSPVPIPNPSPHLTAYALRLMVLVRRRVSPSQPTDPVAAVDVANVVLKASGGRRVQTMLSFLLCSAGLRCAALRYWTRPTRWVR